MLHNKIAAKMDTVSYSFPRFWHDEIYIPKTLDLCIQHMTFLASFLSVTKFDATNIRETQNGIV